MRKLLDLKEGVVLVFHTTVWYCILITSCFKKLMFFFLCKSEAHGEIADWGSGHYRSMQRRRLSAWL